jgi:hypothetical protein
MADTYHNVRPRRERASSLRRLSRVNSNGWCNEAAI